MKKKVDRKQLAVFAVLFAAVGRALAWGHPVGHSFAYYAASAVIGGVLIAGLTVWLTFSILDAVENDKKSKR